MWGMWGLVTGSLAVVCMAPVSQAQECGWFALFGPSSRGVIGKVYELTVFNDGTGPSLYAGGDFTTAGGVTVNNIAKWDGSNWSPLAGPDGTGVSSDVYALTEFDDGSGPALYAGGFFSTAGGVTVNSIAKWDGMEWLPLAGPDGTGVNGKVYALTVFDDGTGPALYAGGSFITVDGVTVNNIAKWDGTEWSPLDGPDGTGVSSHVRTLKVFDDGSGPALYVGGKFTTAGGTMVNYITKWDGLAWSSLAGPSGTGVEGFVWSLAVFDDGSGPALYVGGEFTTAGNVIVNNIAKWDGVEWFPLIGSGGIGTNYQVNTLTAFADDAGLALYIGGWFMTAGGLTVNRIAKWDGAEWSPLAGPHGTGVFAFEVQALAGFDDGTGPAMYIGGHFTDAGGVRVNNIAKWIGCPPAPSCIADFAEPYGLLDLADVVAFVTAFISQDPAADLSPNYGVFDLFDIVAFIVAFQAGCP